MNKYIALLFRESKTPAAGRLGIMIYEIKIAYLIDIFSPSGRET